MVFYSDTICGGAPELCQEFNLERPTAALAEAVANDEPFVMLSRPEVFDMSALRVYTENSRLNAKCVAGKILSIMEGKVLEYDKGYVIRAIHIVSDIIEEVRQVASEMPVTVSPCLLRPVSMEVVRHMAESMVEIQTDIRVVHVPMMGMMSLAEIVYRMSDGKTCSDFGIDNGGKTISQDYKACLDSIVYHDLFGAHDAVSVRPANELLVINELYGG